MEALEGASLREALTGIDGRERRAATPSPRLSAAVRVSRLSELGQLLDRLLEDR